MSKDPAAVKLGRKGGKSTSPAKQAAVRANVAKARKAKKLKLAKQLASELLGDSESCSYCAIRGCEGECRTGEI